ncbi:MAG: hypothetical protein JXR64_04690 [Spirochaetales bacterium]|nr:hypothetical protein [Spirochaetales bacterium]
MKEECIYGFKNRKIKVYIERNFDNENVYIFYPGLNYGYNSPLFYYLVKKLIEKQQNFIFFDMDWKHLGDNAEMTFEEIYPHLINEISISFDFANSNFKNCKFTMIGKSLGSIALEYCKSNDMDKKIYKYMWLTPFKNTKNLREINLIKNKDYIYVGDADSFYDEKVYKDIGAKSNTRIYSGLDHSFNYKNDILDSIITLKDVLNNILIDIE